MILFNDFKLNFKALLLATMDEMLSSFLTSPALMGPLLVFLFNLEFEWIASLNLALLGF